MASAAAEAMPTDVTSRRRPEALLGILFVVLFVAAVFLDSTPDDKDSNAKWVHHYASNSHQVESLLSGFAMVIAAVCAAWFLTTLWWEIASRHPGRTNPLPLVAGAAASAAIALGGTAYATIPGSLIFGSLRVPSADVLRFSNDLGFVMIIVAGMFPMALAIASISLRARRVGLFGRNLTIVSLVLAIITVASFLFFPLLAMLVWFLIASVVLWRCGTAAGPTLTGSLAG